MDKGMNRYLLDTNILIYYFADVIPLEELDTVENILKMSFNISIITRIEFLGWDKHTKEGYDKAKEFVSFAKTIPLNNKIADLTVDIGRNHRIKLPDAVIAATALSGDLILVTRNSKDFSGVEDLEIYNPFKMNDMR
ncbi:MAG: type II toxin-antitoxin system VapC family toxin [Candidatus Methanoperedens sp.]|nr:type II toxin-antitoxin system VapC family toxin [Candidatus Methanoperedens sp.]MCZ7371167.1 type II toxin-antitoxin system VapC family toxin [Candidatus Methanoperedens sp.]